MASLNLYAYEQQHHGPVSYLTYQEGISEEDCNNRSGKNSNVNGTILLGNNEGQRTSGETPLINPSQLVEVYAGANVDRRHEEDNPNEGKPYLAGFVLVVNNRTDGIVGYGYMDTC